MKRLPTIHPDAATPAWQAERLARWLTDWEIDQSLENLVEDAPPDIDVTDTDKPSLVEPYDADVLPGQIRLVGGRMADRLLYLAVLCRQRDGRYLCAPFGRYTEPALPAEWLTGRDAMALRVLCLWNTALLPQSSLAESWVVDTFTDDDLSQALMVEAYFCRGDSMPVTVERRTGPPLIHPADPRRVYREIEAGILDSLLDPSESVNESRPSWDTADQELMKAAEAPERYGAEIRYNVIGFALTIVATASSASQSYRISVVDARGDVSRRLDGSRLISRDGRSSTLIWIGRSWIDIGGGVPDFMLFDDSGAALQLVRVSG